MITHSLIYRSNERNSVLLSNDDWCWDIRELGKADVKNTTSTIGGLGIINIMIRLQNVGTGGQWCFSQSLYENRPGNGTHTRAINNFGTRMSICCDRYYEDVLLGLGNPYIFGSLVSSVVSWFIEKTMYMYVPEHKSVFAMLGMMLHITRNLIIRVNPQHNLVRLSVNSMMFSSEFISRFWYKWLLQWKILILWWKSSKSQFFKTTNIIEIDRMSFENELTKVQNLTIHFLELSIHGSCHVWTLIFLAKSSNFNLM